MRSDISDSVPSPREPDGGLPRTFDLRGFLFGEDARHQIRSALDAQPPVTPETPGLRQITDGTRALLLHELAEDADAFLDVDVVEVLATGWRKMQALTAAARDSLDSDEVHIVALTSHRVQGRWEPRVEVVLAGRVVTRVPFELEVTFDVDGLSASIADGRLVQVDVVRCDLTATFSAEDCLLAKRRAAFDPHLAIPLGEGVVLAERTESLSS